MGKKYSIFTIRNPVAKAVRSIRPKVIPDKKKKLHRKRKHKGK